MFSLFRPGKKATQTPPATAVLYTRQGCCLCDAAKDILQSHGVAVEEVDIDADSRLRSRYTDCVPVVVIDGCERFRGRVEPILLRRLLANR